MTTLEQQINTALGIALAALVGFGGLSVFTLEVVARQSAATAGAGLLRTAMRDVAAQLHAADARLRTRLIAPGAAGMNAAAAALGPNAWDWERVDADVAYLRSASAAQPDLAPLAARLVPAVSAAHTALTLQTGASLGRTDAALAALDALDAQWFAAVSRSASDEAARLIVLRRIAAGAELSGLLLAVTALIFGGRGAHGSARRFGPVVRAIADVIGRELADLSSALERLGHGDLTVEVADVERRPLHVRGAAEIADLTRAYNALIARTAHSRREFGAASGQLRAIVSGISAASTQLASAGGSVSTARSESSTAVARISQAADTVVRSVKDQREALADVRTAVNGVARSCAAIACGAVERARAAAGMQRALADLEAHGGAGTRLAASIAESAGRARDAAADGRAALDSAADAHLSSRAALAAATAALNDFVAGSAAVETCVPLAATSAQAVHAALAGIRTAATLSATALHDALGALDRCAGDARTALNTLDAARGAIDEAALDARALVATAGAQRSDAAAVAAGAVGVSATVDRHAAAAAQIRAATDVLAASIMPLAEATATHAQAAAHVYHSTVALAAQAKTLGSVAADVDTEARALDRIVGTFRLTGKGSGRAVPSDESRRVGPRGRSRA